MVVCAFFENIQGHIESPEEEKEKNNNHNDSYQLIPYYNKLNLPTKIQNNLVRI